MKNFRFDNTKALNPINLKASPIEDRFRKSLDDFKAEVQSDLDRLAKEMSLDAETKRKRSHQATVQATNEYFDAQNKIQFEKTFEELHANSGLPIEWFENFAYAISQDSIEFYEQTLTPMTLGILNRRHSKYWAEHVKVKGMFGTFIEFLCTLKHIQFDMFINKKGGRFLVPVVIKNYEISDEYPDFSYAKAVAENSYPALTPEMRLTYR